MADPTEAGQSGFKLPRFLHWAKGLATAILGPRRTTITITIETERTLIIKRRSSTRCWCPECGREADMVEHAQAALLTGVAQSRQCGFAPEEKWHMVETADGSPLICLESLLNSGRLRSIDPRNPL
jgi:hypothetical protein